jgi:MarR family transcriptional regulator for hemolysin
MTFDRLADEHELVILLNRSRRIYQRAINRSLAPLGLSEAQALPIITIARLGDGVRQGVLAERLGVEGPSLIRQLDQLEATGLAFRRADPKDQRGRTLHLTAKGVELGQKIEAILQQLRRQLLATVNDRDLAATLRTLRTIHEQTEREDIGMEPLS